MKRAEARTHQARGRVRRLAFRPAFDVIESRVLLANFLVTTTADSGPGSLRQAILDANDQNSYPGADTISFGLSTTDPGFNPAFQDWTIHVLSALPPITDLLSIDGYTQRVITGKEAANQSQTVSITGSPTGGTFTLTLNGHTTAPIPYNATSDQIAAALEALPNIGKDADNVSNVSVTGGPINTASVTITFVNRLSLTNVGQFVGNAAGLVGGSSPAVVVSIPTVANTGDIISDPSTVTVGFNGKPRVILDGTVSVPDPVTGLLTKTQAGFDGLSIQTDHNRIRGLAINGFRTGIQVGFTPPNNPQGTSAVGNLIQGNYIGAYLSYYNPTYLLSHPVVKGIGNEVGVIISSPTNNTVGGVTPQTHNAIAGNVQQGIIIDVGAYGNQVVGNLIGVLEQDSNWYYQVGNGAEGVLVRSSSNAIGGVVEGATNVISANGSYGLHVVGSDAGVNRIQGNYIGTDINGTFMFGQGNPGNGQNTPPLPLPPSPTGNLRDGIFIDNSPSNLIGGSVDGATNVVSGNFGAGIVISGASATGNVIVRNYIGTDLDGEAALPNFLEGVAIYSSSNQVGGTNDGDFNVISGNRRGVLISGAAATGNRVLGNIIGTDRKGEYDLGNAFEGVRIEAASSNTVGGTKAGARNLISGNNVGVLIVGIAGTATGNIISGNYIGTDATGTMDLGNSWEGVRIESASGNTIGGTVGGSGNLISANHWGVIITGPTASNNALHGNFIGTDVTGKLGISNEVDGVYVNDGAANNLIGGLGVGRGNSIGFNIRDGVRIESVGSIQNSILSNGIFSNGALGINLVAPTDPPNEVTPNPPGGTAPGPNMLLSKPSLSNIATTSTGMNVSGVYAGAPNTSYVIQIFANTAGDPSGYGEGQTFLGTTIVTTDAIGAGSFTANLLIFASAGQFITATATDTAGNTSEFSAWIIEAVSLIGFASSSFVSSTGSEYATITLVRAGGSGGFATVDYKVANGTAKLGYNPGPNADYTVPVDGIPESTPAGVLPTYYTGTVVFNAGEYVKTFQIPLLDSGLPGPTKSVNLTLQDPTGAGEIGSPDSATLFINNNNLPGTFRFSMANYEVNEADGSITITVLRDIPGIPVSVNYATGGGTAVPGVRYTPVSGILNFAEGQDSATFTIPIIDAPGIQGDQTVGLSLSDPTNGASLGTPKAAILTIHDDLRDRSGPTVKSIRFQTLRGGAITALVVAFDRPVIAATATNLLNYGYSVRTAGRDHQFGTRDDLIIPIIYATYDSSSWSATLSLGRGIHPPTPFLFQINESTNVPGAGVGVAGLNGNLLDGNYDGVAGSPFSVVLVGKSGGFTPSMGSSMNLASIPQPSRASRKQHLSVPRRSQASGVSARPKVIYGPSGSGSPASSSQSRG